MVNYGNAAVVSVVAAIVVISVVAGFYLSPMSSSSATSFSSTFSNSSENSTTSFTATSSERNTSSEIFSLSSSYSSNSSSDSSTVNSTQTMNNSSSEGWHSSDQGMGGPTWQIQENISTWDSNDNYTINCGGWGQDFASGAMDETLCNEVANSNSNDSSPAAYFGLAIQGSSNNEWEFNLGITRGIGQENYTWLFGDGQNGTSISNQTIAHTYSNPGTYKTDVAFLISSSPASVSNWKVKVSVAIYLSTGSGGTSQNSSLVILDPAAGPSTCSRLFDGVVGTGGWNSTSNTCTLSGDPITSPTFLMYRGNTLEISQNVTLILENSGYGFANYGVIVNNGTIVLENSLINYGVLVNHGTLLNHNINFDIMSAEANDDPGVINNTGLIENEAGSGISNGGTMNNNGTIYNLAGATIYNYMDGYNFSSLINNYGMIDNAGNIKNMYTIADYGAISNQGTIVNICDGRIVGNQITGNPATKEDCSK